PMKRLLMGDVGCGKTVVAAAAAYACIRSGKQAALMVPTQILADQHMAYFSSLAGDLGFQTALLTGQLTGTGRQENLDGIAKGKYNLIIGTQALIQEGVRFSGLGLVIIDEQHRFGVRERALMEGKGQNPHLLVMTATPIPRTLAIALYGDMDISMINEYPKGHRAVVTHLAGASRKRAVFETLKKRLSQGEQAFVICPMIEKSEVLDLKNAVDMARNLKKILEPPFRVGLIHGQLSPDGRERIMDDFRKGALDLLVGTTVIEVGVHVPRATMMIVEHPERFGLTQLHQLRGRVGRGSERGLCVLMTSDELSEKSISRLEILVKSHDGFEIAQKDLELRGQGELTGMRQAGAGELEYSDIIREPELLLRAKEAAEELITADPELLVPGHQTLRAMVSNLLDAPLDL
ncbi:MAG: helicase-related protein, partial [Pseudomonadota bacterium]